MMAHVLILFITVFHTINAIGFIYPSSMPQPIEAQNEIMRTIIPYILQYESPIKMRLASAIDETFWNCLATYHPVALDVITKQRPRIPADTVTIEMYGTSETRMLCGIYATLIITNAIIPKATHSLQSKIASFTLDSSLTTINHNVANCDIIIGIELRNNLIIPIIPVNTDCLQNVALTNDFIPEVMGSIVAYQMLDYLQNDGWNDDGSIGIKDDQCTANPRPYSDYTGYEPKMNDPNSWQPLWEHDGNGLFYHYDHITPQIGWTVTPKVISRTELKRRSALNPEYDYKKESEKVVERLKDLATDDEKKILVEFFDDKIAVGIAILFKLDEVLNWSWEERQIWITGYTLAGYDAVIQSWREKRKWDRVRPTTKIKRGAAGDRIRTYGGPYKGIQDINAFEFESYIRVRPHSEYPSGSACICSSIAQFTDSFLLERYSMQSVSVDLPVPGGVFKAGSSMIEPDVTPSVDIGVTMRDMTELMDTCSASRLWGGMHFTASIEGANVLCDGIGDATYLLMERLFKGIESVESYGDGLDNDWKDVWKNGDFSKTVWYKTDPGDMKHKENDNGEEPPMLCLNEHMLASLWGLMILFSYIFCMCWWFKWRKQRKVEYDDENMMNF